MNLLFVTPSETGTGEAMTAGAAACDLRRHGHTVHFAASPTTAHFLRQTFPDSITMFGHEESINRSMWKQTVRATEPDVIVFADYSLLFMTSGTIPLTSAGWIDELRHLRVRLATLDHVGYAQGPGVLYFGPSHLTCHAESFAAVPDDMHILLPCPLFSGPVPGWRGTPFRYWDVPLTLPDEVRDATRREHLRAHERYLLVHSTPGWAIRMATGMRLPHYDYLPRLLAHYLDDLPAPAVLVSVNNGALLPEDTSTLRVVNLPPMSPCAFERLLLSADLVFSDNKVSASVAKAVCAGTPSVVLSNSFRLTRVANGDDPFVAAVVNEMERRRPGSIFPFDVFPMWSRDDLDHLGVFRHGMYESALVSAELFGGSATARLLVELLTEPTPRARVRRAQDAYVAAVSGLASAADVLSNL
jgi:Family of unknown function (DUF6365)